MGTRMHDIEQRMLKSTPIDNWRGSECEDEIAPDGFHIKKFYDYGTTRVIRFLTAESSKTATILRRMVTAIVLLLSVFRCLYPPSSPAFTMWHADGFSVGRSLYWWLGRDDCTFLALSWSLMEVTACKRRTHHFLTYFLE